MINTDRCEGDFHSPHSPLILIGRASDGRGPLQRSKVGVLVTCQYESSDYTQGVTGHTGSVQTVQLNLLLQQTTLSANRLYSYTTVKLV